MREEIFQDEKKKYKVEPDYPFSTALTYPVLRHKDNRKWFALIMDIPRENEVSGQRACGYNTGRTSP